MAVSIPQVVTEDRASGALVIDGSLRFDQSKSNYLSFTPTTTGNRRTWTFSCWFRKMEESANRVIFSTYGSSPWTAIQTTGSGDGRIQATFDAGVSSGYFTDARYRDNGWYHLVWAVDTTQSIDPDKSKLYINGVLQTYGSNGHPSLNEETPFNLISRTMYIGYTPNQMFDGHMSQVYLIDGQALGPGYFGFVDPLTNTWRPKKFRAEGTTVNDGTTWSTTCTFLRPTSGFDGLFNTANAAYLSSAGTGTITTAPFTIKNNLRIYNNARSDQGGQYTVTINGKRVSFNGTGTNSTAYRWTDIDLSGFSLPIRVTNLQYTVPGGSGTGFDAVEVDGVLMLDSTTTNLSFGTNGFYLPMEGNSPIGEDQSGNENNWTPVNFGGSVALDKATGALPILNTLGGTVARAGVFGSEVSANYTTTSNTAAGSGFEFDQTSGFNPSLSFVRGATYTFDYTDSEHHPLRFSSTDPDSSVTSYTDGTNTSVSNTVKITVPHNAPDTLYYYCTSHNSMNGRISVTTDTKKADPYAWKNVLAISGSGSISDSCASINCTVSNKTSTDAGSIAYNSNSNLYSQSIYSAGSTNQYFTVGSSTESDFDATGDFCFEFWHYPVTSGYAVHARSFYFGSADGSSGMQAAFYDGQVDISSASNGLLNGAALQSSTQHKFDQWNHHAITREGNSVRYFQNGVLVDSATQTTPTGIVSGKRTLYIGGNSYKSPQYWQDIRFYNGVAKYTSNFIPASTNPDILPDTPSGVGTKTQLTKVTDGAVTFDGTGDELNLSSHSDLAFGTGNFTIECFAYFNSFDDTYPTVLSKLVGGTLSWIVRVKNDGKLVWYSKNGSGTNNESSTSPIVLKKWHHIAVVREGTGSNQLKGYVDGKEVLTITDSNDYNDSNDLCIGTQQSGGGNTINGFISNVRIINGTALYTSNFIPPTRELTNVTNTKLLCCQSNRLPGGYTVSPTPGGLNDGTIWSSLVSAPSGFDSSYQAELMFNGDTSGTSDAIPALGDRWTLTHNFGSVSTLRYFTYFPSGNTANGANAFEVNGVTVTPTSKTQGGWTSLPIAGGTLTSFGSKYTGSGDYVFVSAIEVDGTVLLDPIGVFGESKATNFNPFNTDINTVRGREGAYATLNPLISTVSLSDGNLKQAQTSGTWNVAVSSIPMSTGKWYCEVTLVGGNTFQIGIIKLDDGPDWVANFPLVDFEYGWGMVVDGVAKLRSDYITPVNGATDVQYNSTAPVAGDTIGMAYDADTQALTFYVNGENYGDTTSYWNYPPTPGEYVFGNSVVSGTDAVWNFGQKPFKFPPPDGFQPLTSSTVRPDTVVPRPDQYFGATLYTGNAGTKSIDVGHKPDFVWIKARTGSARSHFLFDSVRGVQKFLQTDGGAGESNADATSLTSFNNDGFTTGARAGMNEDGVNYVTWTWKSGGNKGVFNVDDVGYATASAAGLTAGTITPTGASVGTKQGFSIIKFTKAANANESWPHGLSQAPSFIITKETNQTTNWQVWHKDLSGDTYAIILNSHNGEGNHPTLFSSAPTDSLVSMGTGWGGGDHIAYCWHDVPGLQKFGKWQGNGSADGPFIETGFRPAVILYKDITSNGYWNIRDSARTTYNGLTNELYPTTADTENQHNSNRPIDFLSNGFKIRIVNDAINNSSREYIYMAWAEAPSFNLYGAQSNAF